MAHLIKVKDIFSVGMYKVEYYAKNNTSVMACVMMIAMHFQGIFPTLVNWSSNQKSSIPCKCMYILILLSCLYAVQYQLVNQFIIIRLSREFIEFLDLLLSDGLCGIFRYRYGFVKSTLESQIKVPLVIWALQQ